LKTKRGQTLGEDISQIIIKRNIFDLKITTKDTLLNEMVIELDVFCSSVEDRIG